jgi:hypothetical protein
MAETSAVGVNISMQYSIVAADHPPSGRSGNGLKTGTILMYFAIRLNCFSDVFS